MKFALLGAEPDALSLLAAVQASPHHELVVAYELDVEYETNFTGADEAASLEIRRRVGMAATEDQWESLLAGNVCDAVIVCRGKNADGRAEQLRKLAQAAVPMIVVHPVGEAVLAFELSMIQDDTGGLVLPYQPELDHTVLAGLCRHRQTHQAEDELEDEFAVQQLSVERRLADSSGVSVAQHFTRDALIVRQIMGPIDQINALAATQDRDNYAGLSVQMSDQNGAVARWTLLPGNSDGTDAGAKWTVHRANGTSVCVTAPSNVDQWRLEDSGSGTGPKIGTDVGPDKSFSNTTIDAATTFLNRFSDDFERHVNGQPVSRPNWEDACRAIELMENVDISRRRKKTVSLHYEDISEDNTFKSLMTTGGCLILILLTLLLPAIAAVESIVHSARSNSQADEKDQTDGSQESDAASAPSADSPFLAQPRKTARDIGLLNKWPMFLFVLLALFVSLQFLRLATRPAATDSKKRHLPSSPE